MVSNRGVNDQQQGVNGQLQGVNGQQQGVNDQQQGVSGQQQRGNGQCDENVYLSTYIPICVTFVSFRTGRDMI